MRLICTLIIATALSSATCAADRRPTRDDFNRDFDFAWSEIATTYAYFESKATSWSDVRTLYSGDLKRVTTRDEFVGLLERMVDELYDPHAQLTTHTATSSRLVPSGTDLWAEWRDGHAVITAVRGDSDAHKAGIEPNSIVLAINDQDIGVAVESKLGRSYPHSVPAARDWALRAVLAGNSQCAAAFKAANKQHR